MPNDDLGQKIERTAKKIGKDIEEEFKDIDLEKKMEDFGKSVEKGWNEKLGMLGPAVTTLFGFAALAIFIYIFKYSEILGKGLAYDIASLFEEYFLILVVLLLVFNYVNYYLERMEDTGKYIKPFSGAASFTISLWFISKILLLVDKNYDVAFVGGLANFLHDNYLMFFFLYLGINFVYLFLKGMLGGMGEY